MKILLQSIVGLIGLPIVYVTVNWLYERFTAWRERRRLRAVERSYYQGYSWAMSTLHTGADLTNFYTPFKDHSATTVLGAFDKGVADAIRAFDAIEGDKMWDKAKQGIAQ
jgi:hypothetical protein